jgi:hypothetical protein
MRNSFWNEMKCDQSDYKASAYVWG